MFFVVAAVTLYWILKPVTLNLLLIKILFISVLGKDNRSIVRILQHHRKSSWHSQLTSTWLAQNQNPFVSLLSPSAEKLSFNGCTSISLLFVGIMCDQMHLFLQSDLILLPETWWWWWCSLQRFKFKWSSSFSHSCLKKRKRQTLDTTSTSPSQQSYLEELQQMEVKKGVWSLFMFGYIFLPQLLSLSVMWYKSSDCYGPGKCLCICFLTRHLCAVTAIRNLHLNETLWSKVGK